MPWSQIQHLVLLSFVSMVLVGTVARLCGFCRSTLRCSIGIGSVVFVCAVWGWTGQGMFPPSDPATYQWIEPNSLMEATQLFIRGIQLLLFVFLAAVLACILTAISIWPLTLFGVFLLLVLRVTCFFRSHAKKGVRILIG